MLWTGDDGWAAGDGLWDSVMSISGARIATEPRALQPVDGHGIGGEVVRGFRALGIVRDAVRLRHPKPVKGPVKYCDTGQSLDPIGCIPAWHYQAKWKSIQHGKRLSVHFVGDHHVRLTSAINRQGFHHIRDRGERRLIKAVERDVDCSGTNAGGLQ